MLEERVVGMITINPIISSRSIADTCHVSRSTVMRILKKHRFHAYKIQRHQELLPGDYEDRQTFCEIMMEKSNTDPDFLSSVCFTDECTFTLNNEPNPQNVRYWAQENPRHFVTTRTQYPRKINVFAGIFRNRLIGPFEVDGNLDATKYLSLLQNEIGPAVAEIADGGEIWYQHDGCPAHYSAEVREYLDNAFPGRWIGRGGPIRWPARSPDLAPCDFFLWGHLKNNIYKTTYDNLDSLRNKLQEECRLISPEQFANVTQGFYNRVGYCLAQNGGHFEHLL